MPAKHQRVCTWGGRALEEEKENLATNMKKAEAVRSFLQGEVGALKTQREKMKYQLKELEEKLKTATG